MNSAVPGRPADGTRRFTGTLGVLDGDPVAENGVMVTETAIWRDQLTAQERAGLGRGAGVIPLNGGHG